MFNNLEINAPLLTIVIFLLLKESMDTKFDCYQFIYSSGYNKAINEENYDSEEEDDLQIVGPAFMSGDIIQIEYDGSSIIYFNKTTQ